MKPTLILPITLRIPVEEDLPQNEELKQRLAAREHANIVEGYTILDKEANPAHAELAFTFYAEINIDNYKLWDLLMALMEELPEKACLIFGDSEEEPTYGKYVEKQQLLEFVSNYKKEVVSDTFLELGFLYHTATRFVEIFVPESKYLRFWGEDKDSFLNIMEKFQLKEIENLEFVDEFPKMRLALNTLDPTVKSTEELIEIFRKEYS